MRSVPPPLWALLLLTATYALSLLPEFGWTFPVNTRPAGLIAIVLALAVMGWAMAQFRRANTQLLPNSPVNNSLVTGGLFALTRNPMYLGMVVFCIGGALWMGRAVMLAAPVLMFAVANWAFIPFEEAKMRRQFGEAFDAYCRKVRRWL